MKYPGLIACFCLLFLLPALESKATHLRAADIIVEKVNCSGLTFKITLRVYVNTQSGTPVGGFAFDDGHLTFGDGAFVLVPPLSVTARPDLGQNIGIASGEFFHTYATEGTYRINYFERDRSGGVINIPLAFDVAYSTYVEIVARRNMCNSFPRLAVAPLDRSCRGVAFTHNPAASDADGDSLSYELTIPSKSSTQFVDGYQSPASPSFYTNFNTGNEAGTGPPAFTIDNVTGLIKWDAPGMQGEYNIAFKVLEWRKNPVTEVYTLISTTIRDMQIVVEDCPNTRPDLAVPVNICIEAGKTVTGKFIGTDPEKHPVKIEVVSEVLEFPAGNSPASVNPVMTDFVSSASPVTVNFEWKTTCNHVRDQSYQVVVKITDDPGGGPRLVTFKTWTIKVIAPKPVWKEVVPDLVNRTAMLSWESYTCANAEKIEIWRKVGSSPFQPGECVAGLSKYKGYQLIATVDRSVTSYHDTNNGRKLSVAAQYCYRLVASFALPAGGKSYVSDEFCLEPILADAPIITNVTIQKTDPAGVVRVKWLKPFDIDSDQYPEPYEYEIYRGNGFTDGGDLVNISGRLNSLAELVYDDVTANTSENIYNYTVVLYSRTRDVDVYNAIDTSATASNGKAERNSGRETDQT